MWLPVLPALHDAGVSYLRKFAVREFVESLNFPLSDLVHKEIAGTAGVMGIFSISQMVRSVRGFFRFPDANHDSWKGDLLSALEPFCRRARFFGFIALVSRERSPFHIPYSSDKMVRLSDNLLRRRVRLRRPSADGEFWGILSVPLD